MNVQAYKLKFRAPVHFGNGRLSESAYTCDAATLFSALYIEALHLGIQDDLMDAAQSGEFKISDAMPYADETLFLPKPMLAAGPESADKRKESETDSRARKAAKKLDYIAADRLSSFLDGSFDFVTELERFDLGESALQTKVNLTRESKNDADPYHVGSFSFREGAGIYFLCEGNFDISPLMEQLAYAGLGGKRSSGFGRFEYSVSSNTPLDTKRAGVKTPHGHMLLSTALPAESELDESLLLNARYRIVRKGGFIQSSSHSLSPQKKRDFYLFTAGSVFPHAFEGSVFDVNETPSAHAVYRYARAMWMEV